MTEGARRKKTKTVAGSQAGQNGTQRRAGRIGGRKATNGRRCRAGKAMKKATTDEWTKRTEADDVEPARTDDSGRWKQTAVETTDDE